MGKKFDIRVWVLITSVQPLTIWVWKKPYLRFTAQDYNVNNFRDKFQHLTNACLKGTKNKSPVKKKGRHVIKNNMWETHQMQDYLMDKYKK